MRGGPDYWPDRLLLAYGAMHAEASSIVLEHFA